MTNPNTSRPQKAKKNIPALRFKEFEGEWVKLKLIDVTEKIQDGTHFSPKLVEVGKYKYITSKNIRKGYMNLNDISFLSDEDHRGIYKRCDVKFNDILLTKDGASTGNACLNELDEEFSLLSSVAFIRANKTKATNNFIYQYITGPRGQSEIRSSIAGQAITRITLTKLRGFKFAYPSLPEQQKIASFLSAIDQKIQQLNRKKVLLAQYKKGIMQQLFSRQIRFKDENGEDFPDWEEKKYGNIFSFYGTNSFSRSKLNYEKGTIKNIHYGDIHTKFSTLFDITKERVPFVNQEVNISKIKTESYCQEGDLVIADASEDYADIGKSIELVELNNEKLIAGLHTFLARPNKSKMEVGFCGYLMQAWYIRKQIMFIAQGTKVLSISTGRLAKLNVSTPSLPEQQKIANFLSSLDSKLEKLGQQIARTQTFKKGLLQQLFV